MARTADARYDLERHFTETVLARLEVRRGLSRSVSLGAGILAGLAAGRTRLHSGTAEPFDLSRPQLPADVRAAGADSNNLTEHYTGVGWLAYPHVSLRWDHGFETHDATGIRPSSLGVFAAAGAGILAAFPGRGDTGLGHPGAFHGEVGLRIHRRRGADLGLSLLHVQCLCDAPTLGDAHFGWTGASLSWILAR